MKKQYMLLLFSFGFCRMLMAQNVGIGTIAPSEKLQVAGNIKADTLKLNGIRIFPNAGIGKILTSDKDGNGIWQANMSPGNSGFGVWGDCATNGNITEYFPVADPTGAVGDCQGVSTAISGNFAIAGSYLDDVGSNTNQGSAAIYQYNGVGWVFMQKLTDPTGAADDNFGNTVSISGNYVVIGASNDDVGANTNQGSACVFRYDGSGWVFVQKITDVAGAASDAFGISVSISGEHLIVGSHLDDIGAATDQGSASLYKLDGENWVFEQKIIDPTGAIGDYFGIAVAIHENKVIVGAYVDDVSTNADQGSVSFFTFNAGSWNFVQKLTDPTGAAGDRLGTSVAIADNVAISGAYLDDVGSNADQGSACIFIFDGANWVFSQKVFDPTGGATDRFGTYISVSDSYAFVSAYVDDVGINVDQGSVSVYQKVGIGWQRLQYITDPGGSASNLFGPCAFDAVTKRFVIGSYGYAGNAGKVVFGRLF